jgi:nitric oxide reductase subunit C
MTDTATLRESGPVAAGVSISERVPLTDVAPATATVTATVQVAATGEMSETGSSAPSEPPATNPALLAVGLAVYRAQYCGICHTLDAAETRGTFGPVHNGMGTLAVEHLQDANYHGTATTAAEYIHESIVDPQAYIVPGYVITAHRMPSYAHLDAESLDALVAFLLVQ